MKNKFFYTKSLKEAGKLSQAVSPIQPYYLFYFLLILKLLILSVIFQIEKKYAKMYDQFLKSK